MSIIKYIFFINSLIIFSIPLSLEKGKSIIYKTLNVNYTIIINLAYRIFNTYFINNLIYYFAYFSPIFY